MDEVSGLMDFLEEYRIGEQQLLMDHDIKLNLIGSVAKIARRYTRSAHESIARSPRTTVRWF